MTRCGLLVFCLLFGCQNAAPVSAAPAPIPAERTFGAPFAQGGTPTDVAHVLSAPEGYLNKTVKCEGTVARVCQAAGCWLELRAKEGGAEGLRVPMAGHAFFVPQDIVGRRAVVEGKLASRDLQEAELSHLRGEGLKAAGPLFLEATSVAVR